MGTGEDRTQRSYSQWITDGVDVHPGLRVRWSPEGRAIYSAEFEVRVLEDIEHELQRISLRSKTLIRWLDDWRQQNSP